MVRLHAARHSDFDMCVALSQKPMHAASVLPPPPGALGDCSLGLGCVLPGDSARLPEAVPPPVANCEGSCGDSGAIAGAWGAGAPSCEAGADVLGDAGLAGGPLLMTPPDEPLPDGRAGAGDPPPERPSWATRGPLAAALAGALSTSRAIASKDSKGAAKPTAAAMKQTRHTRGMKTSLCPRLKRQRKGGRFVRCRTRGRAAHNMALTVSPLT